MASVVAEIDPKALRERCEKRLSGMKQQRLPWEAHWRDIATFEQPMRGRWLCTDPGKGDQFNTKLLNGKAVECIDILANGMASGLTSPSRPWFKLTTKDPDLINYQPVKVWLGEVEDRMRALFQSTNFYTATQSGYRELALYGIEAAIMAQHWREVAVVHPMTAGEFWIGLGDALSPDSLYRRVPMTVGQAVQKFQGSVSAKVRALYDAAKYDEWVPIYHAIEPNPERIPGKLDKTNMVFRSIYWEEGQQESGKEVLAFEGFEQQPFWAPRWDASGSTPVYCRGPASAVLGTAKQLEIKELRLQQAIDYTNRPPLVGPPQLAQAESNLNPGGRTYLAQNDIAEFKPIWTINPAAIPAISNDIARLEKKVERFLYTDLFMAITNMEGIQPRNDTEIGQRVEEKMTQLGPVVERVEKEKLRVAIDIAFAIILKNKMVPPPPPEIHGQELNIEFVSVLAQAQRAVGLGAIERVAGYALNLMRADPAAGDKFNFDKSIDEYNNLAGGPPDIINSDDDVQAIRGQRAKQQQMAQAAAMAKPAADGAAAAKSAAEAAQISGQGQGGPFGFTPGAGAGATTLEGILGKGA